MSLAITSLDAPLGARVEGVDFAAPLEDSMKAELHHAVDEHLVLLFRNGDNSPTNQQVIDFCTSFGPLRPTLADRSRLPGYPGINRVSNRDADGVQGTGGHSIVTWHSDLSFTPPLIEFLWLDALQIAAPGEGNTKWVNLCAAYDALDEATKAHIDDVGIRYRLRDGLDFSSYFKASDPDSLFQDTEISLVQRNPRTGRKSVWPNTGPDFAAEVLGVSADEGAELLRILFAHCTQPQFVYTHEWQVGDACLWINTQTMHEREAFDDRTERVLRHVNILGAADPRQGSVAA
jgi:alpha-ketoglutarate-dependent 2,4-dichlorophenoxyacetate dioxygenase